jgi:antitoxin PrlF
MMESTMTTKGQITVPKAVRDRLRLEPGDKVYFDVGDDGVVRLAVRNQPMERLFGLLRGRSVRRK